MLIKLFVQFAAARAVKGDVPGALQQTTRDVTKGIGLASKQ
jgi:hypothetical protein